MKRMFSSLPFSLSLLAILCFFLFFYGLGNYPLFDIDEPRYAEAAREMLESGNWITPYFNYVVRFDKPIFFYWLVAWAYLMFDISEFSARFFSAVSASMLVFALYGMVRYLGFPRYAMLASLMFATSIQVMGLARMSITDMTLACWFGLTCLGLFLTLHQDRRWWVPTAICSAVACLTKGPVGIILPGGIALVYSLLMGQGIGFLKTRWFGVGLLVWAALTLPWYVLAYQENGMVFLDALLFHNMTRFTGTVSGHDQPWYFFFVVILGGFLPWSLYLPVAMGWFFKESLPVLKGLRQKQLENKGQIIALELDHLAAYGFLWVVLTFLFFSVSQTKLLTYVLPLFPGLALWMGAVWERLSQQTQHRFYPWLIRSTLVLIVVVTVVGVLAMVKLGALLPREAQHMTTDPSIPSIILLLFSAGTMVWWFLRKQSVLGAVATVAITSSVVMVVAIHTLIPQVNQVTQGTMLAFLQTVGPEPVVTYEIQRPSLTYYARRRIEHVASDEYDKLHTLVQTYGRLFVITKNKYMDRLQRQEASHPHIQWKVVQQTPLYSLLQMEYQKP